jgi:hypothetical protein
MTRKLLLVTCAALATFSTFGCTRGHYRKQADKEVNCIIDNKAAAVGAAPACLMPAAPTVPRCRPTIQRRTS